MNDKHIKFLAEKLDSGFLLNHKGKTIAIKDIADLEAYIVKEIKSSFWFHGNGVKTTEITFNQCHNPPQKS